MKLGFIRFYSSLDPHVYDNDEQLIWFQTFRPKQNVRHFPDDIFEFILFYENGRISIKITLECVSQGPIDTIPALVQIMAWRRIGDRPLSEPIMDLVSDAYMRHWAPAS